MVKKALTWAIIISIVLVTFFLIFRIMKKETKSEIGKENETNTVDISENSEGEVTDSCLDEWDAYNQYIGEKIEEASNSLVVDDTHYLLKDVWGYIEVYYLDDEHNEYLYKKTSIATDYLSQEDIDDLKIGIEVVGAEAMNKMLEDFE